MNFKNHILKLSILVLIPCITSISAATCTAGRSSDDIFLKPSTLVVSFKEKKWDFLDSKESNAISIDKCAGNDGDTLQLAKIPLSYNPENYQPQYYESTMLHALPITCNLDSDLITPYDTQGHSAQYKKIYSYLNECVGLEVTSLNEIAIEPIAKPNCTYVSLNSQKTKFLISGDNCQIKKPTGGYHILPVIKEECYQTDILKSGLGNLEGTIRILQTGRVADPVASKDIQLVINSDLSNATQNGKTAFKSSKFQFVRPSDYSVDFDFAQLKISGNVKAKLVASAKYLVRNKSEKCGEASCLNSSSYRVPLLVRNELYLAKANSISDRIFLGKWYNASIVPAQWEGLDGSPVTNAVIYNWNSIQLNSSIEKAETGDSLVLVSTMINPNSAIKTFLNAGDQYFERMNRVSLRDAAKTAPIGRRNSMSGFGSLPVISPLPELNFNSVIPELDFDALLNSDGTGEIKDSGKTWLVKFLRFCSQSPGGSCLDMSEVADFIKIESESKMTITDGRVQLKPLAMVKRSSLNELSKAVYLTKPTQISCLKNPIKIESPLPIQTRRKK